MSVRRLARLGYRHAIILFVGTATCLFAILLAGCSSSHPGLPGVYLLGLSYQHAASGGSVVNQNLSSVFTPLVGDIELTVRTGYFGLCIRSTSEAWICNKDATLLKSHIDAAHDPLDLITISKLFKDDIVFSGLMYVGCRHTYHRNAFDLTRFEVSSRLPSAS